MRLRRLLQRIEAEDAERVVDILGRSRSQPRDAGQLEERRRDLALESSQEFQLSAGDKLDDLLLHRLTDAGDFLEPSFLDQVLDFGGQVVELPDGLPVGADLEKVLPLDLEQVGHPVEHGRNVGIPHVANLAGMLLVGVRVLDLSRLLPGAYCTQLLQGQGAQVTKIEPPAADPIRGLPGGEAYFNALHRGQQVVTIDLRTESGHQALRRRILDADVLVEGFRPGVLDRIELGYAALSAINPALVYCAITGYGSSGPMARRAGHDLNYLARSGALSLMPQREGVPTIPGFPVADLAGGLPAALFIGAALAGRVKTGRGSRVEVSMTGLMLSWTALPRAALKAGLSGLPLTGELPCYHVYPVPGGCLTVAAQEAAFWAEFCHTIGRDALTERQFDPSAADDVQSALASATRDEWMARFRDRAVCVEPVLGLAELNED